MKTKHETKLKQKGTNLIIKQSSVEPEGYTMMRQLAHEGNKVVSLTHQPPLPPRKYTWYSFPLEAESTSRAAIVRPNGVYQ
jgi:hypothetical protein